MAPFYAKPMTHCNIKFNCKRHVSKVAACSFLRIGQVETIAGVELHRMIRISNQSAHLCGCTGAVIDAVLGEGARPTVQNPGTAAGYTGVLRSDGVEEEVDVCAG